MRVMCGRFTLTVSEEEWIRYFHVQHVRLKFEPRFNIAPGQHIAAIIADDNGVRRPGCCAGDSCRHGLPTKKSATT